MALPVSAGVLEREMMLRGVNGKQQSTRWLVTVLLSLGGILNTVMRRLTTGYVLRNASLGDFVVVRRS